MLDVCRPATYCTIAQPKYASCVHVQRLLLLPRGYSIVFNGTFLPVSVFIHTWAFKAVSGILGYINKLDLTVSILGPGCSVADLMIREHQWSNNLA